MPSNIIEYRNEGVYYNSSKLLTSYDLGGSLSASGSNTTFTAVMKESTVNTYTDTNFIPQLTGNTSNPLYTTSASVVNGGSAYGAFGSPSSGSWQVTTISNVWIQVQLSTAKVFTAYTYSTGGAFWWGAPANYKIQGSQNGSTWTDLLSVTTASGSGSGAIPNTTAYLYYRMYIINGHNNAGTGGMQLYNLNFSELVTDNNPKAVVYMSNNEGFFNTLPSNTGVGIGGFEYGMVFTLPWSATLKTVDFKWTQAGGSLSAIYLRDNSGTVLYTGTVSGSTATFNQTLPAGTYRLGLAVSFGGGSTPQVYYDTVNNIKNNTFGFLTSGYTMSGATYTVDNTNAFAFSGLVLDISGFILSQSINGARGSLTGFVPNGSTAGQTVTAVTSGFCSGFTGLTVGSPYMISDFLGVVLSRNPSAGTVKKMAGVAENSTTLNVAQIAAKQITLAGTVKVQHHGGTFVAQAQAQYSTGATTANLNISIGGITFISKSCSAGLYNTSYASYSGNLPPGQYTVSGNDTLYVSYT